MSVSAVAPTPFYQDPDRLPIGLPQASADDKAGTPKDGDKRLSMFAAGDDEPSFWDVLDVINPLQHIPVVGNLYRELTGDQIGVGARLVGGTLFGGPIGLIASAMDCVVEESTGKDAGGHMLALFRDEGDTAPSTTTTTQYAQAKTPEAGASAANEPPLPAAAPNPPVTAEAVSSSPAKAAAGAMEGGAPVITLPMAGAATPAPGAPQPMVFSLDGMQAAAPAPSAAQALADAKPAVADAKPAVADAKPLPLTANAGRTMPAPARNANANPAPPPPLTVPVSTSGGRSNTPITGRSPTAAANAVAAQERLGSHPMLPPTDGNGQTASGPDWFSAAWGQALDKYQRANQRNDKAAPATTSSGLQ